MDPLTLVLTALGTGAAAGISGTMSQAIKDMYSGLKSAVRRHWEGNSKALATIEDFDHDPEVYEKPLLRQLEVSRIQEDAEVIALAQAFLDAVQSEPQPIEKYRIAVTGGQVGNIGDHGSVIMNATPTDPRPRTESDQA